MKIKLSKSQWESIGKVAGWIKQAQDHDNFSNDLTNWQEENAAMSRNQCGYCESYNCDGTCTYGEELNEVIESGKHYKTVFDLYKSGQNEALTIEIENLKKIYYFGDSTPMAVLNYLSDLLSTRIDTLKRMEVKRPELRNRRLEKFTESGLDRFMQPFLNG